MLVNIKLKTGMSKKNEPWYMMTVVAGKYKSEPIFISAIEYDYLYDLNLPVSPELDINDENK